MHTDHKSIETMRAYLLGRLPEDEASALEQEYFVNRPFLLKLQSEETALIEDYLDGNLGPAERQSFEKQYLQLPELQRKVEQVRGERRALVQTANPPLWGSWRLGLAAALVVLLGVGIWIYHLRTKEQTKEAVRPQGSVQPNASVQTRPQDEARSAVQDQSNERNPWARNRQRVPVESAKTELLPMEPAPIGMYLVPSITQGAASRQREFTQPANDASLNLILELPGQTASVTTTVTILRLGPYGELTPVWSSPKATSDRLRGRYVALLPSWRAKFPETNQVLILSLPGSLFQPGDYIVEASIGQRHNTYTYRVLTNQNSDQR